MVLKRLLGFSVEFKAYFQRLLSPLAARTMFFRHVGPFLDALILFPFQIKPKGLLFDSSAE
jgi:hypothetical protein